MQNVDEWNEILQKVPQKRENFPHYRAGGKHTRLLLFSRLRGSPFGDDIEPLEDHKLRALFRLFF